MVSIVGLETRSRASLRSKSQGLRVSGALHKGVQPREACEDGQEAHPPSEHGGLKSLESTPIGTSSGCTSEEQTEFQARVAAQLAIAYCPEVGIPSRTVPSSPIRCKPQPIWSSRRTRVGVPYESRRPTVTFEPGLQHDNQQHGKDLPLVVLSRYPRGGHAGCFTSRSPGTPTLRT